jgi:hypothetical protein
MGGRYGKEGAVPQRRKTFFHGDRGAITKRSGVIPNEVRDVLDRDPSAVPQDASRISRWARNDIRTFVTKHKMFNPKF